MRIITNKPDPEAFSAGADLTAGTISDGDGVRTLEGFANIPLSDRAAVRLVGWYDASDGFIDTVATARTFRNGVTVSNDRWAEDDYNEEETLGFRATLRSDLGERWRGTIAAVHQKTEFEGAWDHEPRRVGNLENARFGPEYGEQQYIQVGWTLEGNLGIGDIVYAGAYFERNRDVILDYSDYVEYASFGGWIQQFACDDFYWYGGNHAYWWMPGIQHDGGPGEYYILVNGGSPFPDEWWSIEWANAFEQKAVFGELTYDFSDRLSRHGRRPGVRREVRRLHLCGGIPARRRERAGTDQPERAGDLRAGRAEVLRGRLEGDPRRRAGDLQRRSPTPSATARAAPGRIREPLRLSRQRRQHHHGSQNRSVCSPAGVPCSRAGNGTRSHPDGANQIP